MSTNFADRLIAAIEAKNTPACVGIDPVYDRLPQEILDRNKKGPSDSAAAAEAIHEYCLGVIRVVAPLVPVVKLNIAFFEVFRDHGIRAYFDLVAQAHQLGLLVIGDVKRGDIGHSSAMYAQAQLSDPQFADLAGKTSPDSVTINAYLGTDGVAPFCEIARAEDKGVFILVHTSNDSAAEIQHLKTEDGSTVAERMARLVDGWGAGKGMVGKRGYSCIGGVVAPGDVEMAKTLRAVMPKSIFLVPGFGAQGRSVEQVAACFKSDGTGAIVNASRSVLYAYQNAKYCEAFGGVWERCVEQACRDFIKDLSVIYKGGS